LFHHQTINQHRLARNFLTNIQQILSFFYFFEKLLLLQLHLSLVYQDTLDTAGLTMKKNLLFIFLIIATQCFGQCPFPVLLDSTGNCIGSILSVRTDSTISKIVWYKENVPIKTVLPITPNAGITVAGGNGPDSAANQLNFPKGIYLDEQDNLYIADNVNNRVQKWSRGMASGTTVAGGHGAGAGANQFNGPEALYLDGGGNIYIMDYGNFRVQKWAPGATSGTTVAGGNGSGSAANQFDFSTGMFIDAAGNIYIADAHNNRIQKWQTGATSAITVAGGNGAGAGANQLNIPTDVFVDEAGDIYITDLANQRIQKWAPGAVSGITVAGGNGFGTAGNQLGLPNSLSVDKAGNVYVCDGYNDRVQKWSPGATSGITVAGGNGRGTAANQLYNPSYIFVANNGDIYVSDEQNARIQKWVQVSIDSTYSTTITGSYTAVVTNNNGCAVTTNAVVISAGQAPFIAITASSITTTSCEMVSFNAVAVNGGGSPFYQWQINGANMGTNSTSFSYNSWQNSDVVKCILTSSSACGIPSTAISNAIALTVTGTSTVTIKSKGGGCLGDTLYISGADSLTLINWYNGTGMVKSVGTADASAGITVAGGNGQGTGDNQLNNPMGIFVDALGNLFITDTYNNRIQRWEPGATTGSTVAGISSIFGSSNPDRLDHPRDVYVDTNGDIYISDPAVPNSRIQKWSVGATTGVRVAGFNGPGTGPEQFNGPFGLWVDLNKNLYVVDQGNNRVQKWLPGATVGITVAGGNGPGDAANQFNGPTDLYLDMFGNLYVVDLMNARVQKWSPGAASGITVAGGNGPGSAPNQITNPIGVAVDHQGNVYATIGITVAGGNGSGDAPNQLSYPTSVFVDPAGNIYVSDMGNNRIQKWIQANYIDTIYQPVSAGTFTAVVTNSGGCMVTTAPILIHPKSQPAISIIASDTSICSGSNVSFTATAIDGGNSPHYQWQVNGVNVGSNAAIYRSDSLSAGALVRCILTSNAPCASITKDTSGIIVMEVINQLAAAITITASQMSICPGTEVIFTATPSNAGATPSYQWKVNGNNAGTNNAIFTTKNLQNGDVVYCVISSNLRCYPITSAISNSISIVASSVTPSVSIVASKDFICPGEPVIFKASVSDVPTGLSYQWLVHEITVGTNSAVYTGNNFVNGDIIKCVVKNEAACGEAISNSIVLTVSPIPVVAPQIVTVQQGQSVMLSPSITGNIISYFWSPPIYLSDTSIQHPITSPLQDINYHLQVISAKGCSGTGDITVKVISLVALPAAFTPNGDGKNDIFYLLGYEPGSLINHFSIFNRWGQLIFQKENLESGNRAAGWDGNYKGAPAPPGAYVYIIYTTLANGAKKVFKGTVELIR
jgi:gliding motility-associated-like protein